MNMINTKQYESKDLDSQEIYTLNREGKSYSELARIFKVNQSTIAYHVRKHKEFMKSVTN